MIDFGWGRLVEVKAQAARRWCAAVNASGEFGNWQYFLAMNLGEVVACLDGYGASAMADA
jgi:hypothetical protein